MIRRLVRYIKGLEVTQGAGLGDPLRLYPWERRFIRGAFDPDASTAGLSVEPVADPGLSVGQLFRACNSFVFNNDFSAARTWSVEEWNSSQRCPQTGLFNPANCYVALSPIRHPSFEIVLLVGAPIERSSVERGVEFVPANQVSS